MKARTEVRSTAAIVLAMLFAILPASGAAAHSGTTGEATYQRRSSCYYTGNTLSQILVRAPEMKAAAGYTNQKVSWTYAIQGTNSAGSTTLRSSFSEAAYAPDSATAAAFTVDRLHTPPAGYDSYRVRYSMKWFDADGTSVIGSAAHYGNVSLRQGTHSSSTSIDVNEPGCVAENHAPVVASDTYSVAACQTLSVPRPGAVANDSDPDRWQRGVGDLKAVVMSTSFARADHAFAWYANGAFTYRANCNNAGNVATIRYALVDDWGMRSEATVTINVTGGAAPPPSSGNRAPTASNASYHLNGGYTHVRQLSASDPEGGALRWELIGQSFASSTHKFIWYGDGRFSITPPNGTAPTFKFRVCDPQGACSNTATVSITTG